MRENESPFKTNTFKLSFASSPRHNTQVKLYRKQREKIKQENQRFFFILNNS